MNIILAEIGAGGEQKPGLSFSQSVILVGRNASECDIAFDNERYPMVSRKHAEFRWQDGKWYVVDLNSSYGTYVDSGQVTQPRSITAGTSIQFGTDGPVMKVVWFEDPFEASELKLDAAPLIAKPPVEVRIPENIVPATPVAVNPPAKTAPAATLEFADLSRPAFNFTKNEIWIGRESDCDIIFDAASGTVSRKHASIRVDQGEYVLADNNSFNGTLLNEHRLASPVPLSDGDSIRF